MDAGDQRRAFNLMFWIAAGFFAMRWMTDRSAGFLTTKGAKPNENEGDVMLGAGAASVFDAASIENASSSACPSAAEYQSTFFSGALHHFMIASAPPAFAISRDVGGGAPPSCI